MPSGENKFIVRIGAPRPLWRAERVFALESALRSEVLRRSEPDDAIALDQSRPGIRRRAEMGMMKAAAVVSTLVRKRRDRLMSPDELQQNLTLIHTELAQTAEVDDATRQRLKELIADIQRLAGPPDRPSNLADEPETSLSHGLQSMIERFEARHPQLTATLQQLVDRLAEIGI